MMKTLLGLQPKLNMYKVSGEFEIEKVIFATTRPVALNIDEK